MSNVIQFQNQFEICINELLPELLDRLDRSIELCMMLEKHIPEIEPFMNAIHEAFIAVEDLQIELERQHGTV